MMNLLLDTHILLWSLLEPDRLSPAVREYLEDPENTLWLSPISVWEIMILAEKKRIILKKDAAKWIQEVFRKIPLKEAPVNYDVAIESRRMTLPQQDPADRFIAATAKVFDLTLITADQRLMECPEISIISSQ